MAETLNLNRCRSKLGLIRSETLARSLQTIRNRIGFNKSAPLLLQVSGEKFQQLKNLFLFEDVSQDIRPMFVGFSIKLLVSSIGGVFTCCKSLSQGPMAVKQNRIRIVTSSTFGTIEQNLPQPFLMVLIGLSGRNNLYPRTCRSKLFGVSALGKDNLKKP